MTLEKIKEIFYDEDFNEDDYLAIEEFIDLNQLEEIDGDVISLIKKLMN